MKTPSFGNHQSFEDLSKGKHTMEYFKKQTQLKDYIQNNAIQKSIFEMGDKMQKYAIKLGHNLTQVQLVEPLQQCSKGNSQSFVLKKSK